MHRSAHRHLALILGYAISAIADLRALNLLAGHAIAGASDWVPAKDEDLDAFCINWDTLLTAAPGTYALTAPDATAFHAARLSFTNALALLAAPDTNNAPNVTAKDTAKANLKTILRQQAGLIQASPAVTNEDKTSIGLPIHSTSPAPVPPPATFPLLNITAQGVRTMTLRFSDSETPDSARKPDGAVGLELHVDTGTAAITDQDAIAYYGLETRNPVEIDFNAGDAGKTASICGRWITSTGQIGPWSAIINRTVAA